MAENFKVGDVVEVKSGGPDMTVVATRADGDVVCLWFNLGTSATYEPRQHIIPSEALRKKDR